MYSSKVDKGTPIGPWTCIHEHVERRIRTIKSGTVQHVDQCLRCGKADPVKRALWQYPLDPPPYDPELRDQWHEYSAYIWAKYNHYLQSDAWKQKRLAVLHRAKQWCERCEQAQAVQAHHITYERIFNERLDDLMAVCVRCHEILHKLPQR